MKTAILIFDRLTVLDAVGPYEVLSRLPDSTLTFVGPKKGEVRSDNRSLGLMVDATFDEVTAADLLVVSGGFGVRALEHDPRALAWLRDIDRTTRVTASVCTGALALGAAGLLTGRRANTHWAYRDALAAYGAIVTPERIVRDGKYATAAGVSAGIDLALALAMELAGPQVAAAIQLGIEYDPAPPLDFGDAARAPEPLRAAVIDRIRAREARAV